MFRIGVIIVPCAEIFLTDYFSKHKSITENQKLRIKADISNVKLLTNSLLVNSNQNKNFYRNFFQENQLPPTFFVSQDDTRTQVRRLEEITQPDYTEDLEFSINLVRKFMKRPPLSKGSILSNARKKQINNIVHHLKPQRVIKRVRFNEQVTCLKLVSPSEVYHCLYPKITTLKDSFDPPIRKLESNIWCVCARCRILLPGCSKEQACDMCFGSGKA